jgi:uncharacterized protein (DUF2267 family)
MRTRCRQSLGAVVAFVLLVGAVSAAVRAWRRERDRQGTPPPWPRVEPDTVLADRVRSTLGTVEATLDVPHLHVMVERGVVLLHGDVPNESTERVLVERARQVRGVRDVVSHLHAGLLPGDTRPSDGAPTRSHAATRLLDAAAGAGGGEATAELAVRAVLASFARAMPSGARRRLATHLPPDVASWLESSEPLAGWQTVDELYADVATREAFAPAHTPWVVAAVLRELRSLVPADVDHIAHELRPAVRHLWMDAAGV